MNRLGKWFLLEITWDFICSCIWLTSTARVTTLDHPEVEGNSVKFYFQDELLGRPWDLSILICCHFVFYGGHWACSLHPFYMVHYEWVLYGATQHFHMADVEGLYGLMFKTLLNWYYFLPSHQLIFFFGIKFEFRKWVFCIHQESNIGIFETDRNFISLNMYKEYNSQAGAECHI